MLQNKKNKITQSGFTIVELLVGIGITSVLSIVLVAYMSAALSQSAISTTRSKLSASTQTALIRVNDDIRNSAGVASYNLATDANAPSGGEWATSATTLILASPATKTSGDSYDSSLAAFDSIIYYIKDGSLYKRIVAYQDPDNRQQTLTCGGTSVAGGCPSDTLLANNATNLSFEYFTKSGASTSEPILAYAVKTTLSLRTVQSAQTVNYTDSATMSPRVKGRFVSNAQLTAGFGGLSFPNGVVVNGGSGTTMYSSGGLQVGQGTFVGTAPAPVTRIDVRNNGCGSGASYGSSCSPTQPIPITGSTRSGSEIRATRLCARDQVSTNGGAFGAMIYGLASCTPSYVEQPLFDKAAHVAKMTNPATGSRSCQGLYGCNTLDLPANTKYVGNVSAADSVNITIRGDMYITGDLTLGNASPYRSTVMIDPALTTRPIIVVNGKIRLRNIDIVSNANNTPIFISFFSMDAAKSNSDSYVTQDPQTIYGAVSSGFSADDAVSLDGAGVTYTGTFYAYFGKLTTNISTTVNGTLAAQKIELGYNTTINLRPYPWFE